MHEHLDAMPLPALALGVLAFFLGLSGFAVAYGFVLQRFLAKRRVFDLPLAAGQHRFELIGNVVFVAVATATVTAALAGGWVRFGAGWGRGVATFFALLIGFQVYYYALHRAMHHRALIRWHRWHHRSHVTTPLTGQSVSFGEAIGWMGGYVGLPVLFSIVEPVSLVGWAAYLAFNITGNIVGHSNVEPTPLAGGSRAATWFVNVFVYHALHHARWNGHYGFQAALMDRLFGTEFADWPALFARVSAGRPMTSLKERGTSAPDRAGSGPGA